MVRQHETIECSRPAKRWRHSGRRRVTPAVWSTPAGIPVMGVPAGTRDMGYHLVVMPGGSTWLDEYTRTNAYI